MGAVALLSACGSASPESTDSGATIDEYCQTLCSRSNECDNHFDVQICEGECMNANAVSGPKLRKSYLGYVAGCFAQQDCATVLDGETQAACADEALVALSPSNVGVQFCDVFGEFGRQCGVSANRTECLGLAKQFSDSTLKEVDSCFAKPCSLIVDCMESVLGLSVGGGSNSCQYAYDGECDEGEYCEYGTDSADCS